MATVQVAGEVRFLIDEVNWEAYEALLRSWESRSKRMTYDRGRLEFMSPLLPHERFSRLLCEMIWTFTTEHDIPKQNGGSTTLKQQSLERGLEPDECFWIQNAPRMNSRGEFDPEEDPRPIWRLSWTSPAVRSTA